MQWFADTIEVGVDSALGDERLERYRTAVRRHPGFKLLGARRRSDESQTPILVVRAADGTIAPGNAAGIRRNEDLALFFPPGQGTALAVRPLRVNFPDTLHQNGVAAGEGHELCLYDVPWAAVERRFSPSQVLSRILVWLRETAEGTLHQQDQPLEQVFFDSGVRLVVPHDFRTTMLDPTTRVQLALATDSDTPLVLRAATNGPAVGRALDRPCRVLTLTSDPVENAPVLRAAYTLGELDDALSARGVQFASMLADATRALANAESTGLPDDNSWTLVIVAMPRIRNGVVERADLVAAHVHVNAAKLGIALGSLMQANDGGPAAPFVMLGADRPEAHAEWRGIKAWPVSLSFEVSRAQARVYAGIPDAGADSSVVLAGIGALGSGIAHIWAREAWGCLTLIDADHIEPHNLVRHTAYQSDVLRPKVEVVAEQLTRVLAEPAAPKAVQGDAGDVDSPDIRALLQGASLLVDATTTLEVPRRWSRCDGLARAASIFLTPSGHGFALLLEDRERHVRLTDLEAQYYGLMLRQPRAEHYLQAPHVRRTGGGCRDKSVVMSPEQIATATGVLSRRLRLGSDQHEARIETWQVDDETGRIDYLKAPVASVVRACAGDWGVTLDAETVARMRALREGDLPNETGGILLGMIDHAEHSIHIVAAMPAPPDSIKSPSGFVRGKQGVAEDRARAQVATQGMVDYVGEWHSHPPGCPALPSHTDEHLIVRISEQTAHDGTPAVMLIVSADDLSISIGDASGAIWR